MLALSPLALRLLEASMNAADDGLAGIQQLAGDATLLCYVSEEAQEGRNAYVEKRKPEFHKFPRRPCPPAPRPLPPPATRGCWAPGRGHSRPPSRLFWW